MIVDKCLYTNNCNQILLSYVSYITKCISGYPHENKEESSLVLIVWLSVTIFNLNTIDNTLIEITFIYSFSASKFDLCISYLAKEEMLNWYLSNRSLFADSRQFSVGNFKSSYLCTRKARQQERSNLMTYRIIFK